MKKNTVVAVAFALLLVCSCHNASDNKEDKPRSFPRPGTVVATGKMPVIEDSLNHSEFSVKVIADSNIAEGVYDVDADFGPNFATSKLAMPKGAEDAKPVIRKGSDPYTFIIGFKVAGDTAFYEYFEVRSSKTATRMQYLKSYTFQ